MIRASKEIWKCIKGFEGYYQISSIGRIRSVDRTITFSDGRVRWFEGKILKTYIDKGGYSVAVLKVNSKQINVKVHRLVAEAFIYNKNNKPEVNHINEIKTDNRVENLEWCTRSENVTHNGLSKRNGLNNRNGVRSKNVYQYDKNGILIGIFPSTREAHRHGYNCGLVSRCANGKINHYKGYIWRYERL